MRQPVADAEARYVTSATTNMSSLRRVMAGTAAGQFVEWYDYGIYGFLTVPIAANFFSGASTSGLLSTFAVFAVTFVFRPFGGIVGGFFADRFGRRKVLITSLMAMSLATAAAGLLPTAATIGIAAPLLLVLLRVVQGLSAGGELGSVMSFAGEHAPANRRAFVVSFAQIGSFSSLLTGSLMGLLLTEALTEEQLHGWGWRLPFFVALPLGIVGLYIRKKVAESPAYQEISEAGEVASQPVREALTSRVGRRAILVCATLSLLNSSGYYVLTSYMPAYLQKSLHFDPTASFGTTAVGILALLCTVPLTSRWSDRIGRKPVLLTSSIATCIVVYPGFLLVDHRGALSIVGMAIMFVCFAMYTSVIQCVLVELFPTRIRVTAYSIGYNISTAIFGGAAPLFLTYFIDVTGDSHVPAYYIIATAVGTLLTTLAIPETAKKKLKR
ncbi:MFS transporter [Saccharopolyspora spinosa]|uniref:MHS family proline/betaine transporter-like MFS transporter n=1 Tax=Saccharopolyspora spinosa TaxID=60894 RepID=A0A2N3XZX5_SACSN|nr:MFS transporter [Saccharopolyspora spinosa]PKW16223.1 MHS family proline/betaine transporter-like MFS transporter [Saccharopolyspora spinosa]